MPARRHRAELPQPMVDLGRNAMKRPEKAAVIAQLTEQFRNADAIYLTEYRGLTVPQISDLREKLGRDTSYAVAKNTLARIAAKEAGIEGLDETLAGPTAITFVKGDYVEAAKTLRDFAKVNKPLVLKAGFADGTVYDAEGVKKLADLESREVLLSKMAGALKGTMAKAAYLFVALPTKAVRTIDALREKQEKAA
jgi:large subunit ribosomal protein L10